MLFRSHVAVIVGSYGPFTLGMILGVINLFLIIIANKKNLEKVKSVMEELTIVNELALTVGLIMLTIGNFLGAQWTNESWGRYWGWDPKETWALVSIMVYAFVIHMRIVPPLRGASYCSKVSPQQIIGTIPVLQIDVAEAMTHEFLLLLQGQEFQTQPYLMIQFCLLEE